MGGGKLPLSRHTLAPPKPWPGAATNPGKEVRPGFHSNAPSVQSLLAWLWLLGNARPTWPEAALALNRPVAGAGARSEWALFSPFARDKNLPATRGMGLGWGKSSRQAGAMAFQCGIRGTGLNWVDVA